MISMMLCLKPIMKCIIGQIIIHGVETLEILSKL